MEANDTKFLFGFCTEIQILEETLSKRLLKSQLLPLYKCKQTLQIISSDFMQSYEIKIIL